VYATFDEDLHDALITFLKPTDPKVRESGLFQFKDILFRTRMVDSSGSIGVGEDELKMLVDNFVTNYGHEEQNNLSNLLEVDQLRGLLENTARVPDQNSRNEIIRERFVVNKLRKASVHFANDICQLWCSRCKQLFFERDIVLDEEYNRYRCKKCNRTLQVTPVWVLKRRDPDNEKRKVVHPLPVWISDRHLKIDELWKAWSNQRFVRCPYCENGVLEGFKSLDPARLLLSARIYCSTCRKDFGLWSNKNFYSLQMPGDSLTRAFVVSCYNVPSLWYKSFNLLPMLSGQECFDCQSVEQFLYSPEAKIKEIVLGYYYGANVKDVIKSDRYGRELITAALYLRLKRSYYGTSYKFMSEVFSDHPKMTTKLSMTRPDDLEFRKLVLHSIAHAIISRIPVISGITMDNFSYLYDINQDSVVVYETAPGGVGACAGLTQTTRNGDPMILEFLSLIKADLTECTCDDRCKYCIAILRCEQWNKSLNRFALAPILRVTNQHAMSWGFS
jgi:transposase-like protein